jgi:hydrogenase maturation protease
MSSQHETILVIGLGNLALSDDGLGIHAVRRLPERYELGPGIEMVEGGTAGLLLLPLVADADAVIIVDAITAGAPAGTLLRLAGEDVMGAFDLLMTPHDVGVADLLRAARLTGAWPDRLVVLGAQPACVGVGTELSEPLGAVLDQLVEQTADELAAWGASVQSRVADRPAFALHRGR